MKKLNTTYLDNLVSKILKETLEEKADTLVSKIKGDVCECGGPMYEGECSECGYKGEMEEGIYDVDKTLDDEFDYVGESEDFEGEEENTDEDAEKTCKYHIENFGENDPVTKEMCQGVNITEALKGRRKLDKNKNNKIDAEDFEMLRNNSKSAKAIKKVNKVSTRHGMEEQETEEGNAFSGALADAKKSGKDSFEVDDKKYQVKESYRLTETEMVSLIEKIVKEEKDKTNIKVVGGSPKGLEKYKQIHAKDGKENDDNIKAVAKKMKEYLKDGSKGDYDMNPKIFPKGNGELEKMKKKAYTMSDSGKEFIEDFMSPGMEVLEYDQIDPNEDQITANIEGSSKTGNDSSYANAVETDVNKKVNAKRKANKFAKARAMAYNKAPQPVKDYTGEESGKGVNIKLESTEKKTKQINEEFDRMKSLIGYNRKTQ